MEISRVSERISCKESPIFFFFANLVFIPHIRQNYSIFSPTATKINLKKVISTISARYNLMFLSPMSKLKMNEYIFVAVISEVIGPPKVGRWVKNSDCGSD